MMKRRPERNAQPEGEDSSLVSSLISRFSSEASGRLALFRAPGGESYVDVCDSGIRQTWPVLSDAFLALLMVRSRRVTGKAPSTAEMKRIAAALDAEAKQAAVTERDVHLRAASTNTHVYVDLCDSRWSAIEIGPDGWSVVPTPPVRFMRTPTMAPLPVPVEGGSLEVLRSLINVSDEHFVLTVSWLLSALRNGSGGHPVLVLRGSEGTAKSTTLGILRALVDPSSASLGPVPNTERALVANTRKTYLQTFDNVRVLTGAMSDAICRLSTGIGSRPVVINSIEDVVTRPDLADRCVFVNCDVIRPDRRRSQAEICDEFARSHAPLFGVLCGAISHGLRKLPGTRVDRLPRMADFALWATSAETAFWNAGTFERSYYDNIAETAEAIVVSDPVASAVRLLAAKRASWTGTASDLDCLLRAISGYVGPVTGWPVDPPRLAKRLRQCASVLFKLGVSITFRQEGHGRTRLITIEPNSERGLQVDEPLGPSAPSAKTTAADAEDKQNRGDQAISLRMATSDDMGGTDIAASDGANLKIDPSLAGGADSADGAERTPAMEVEVIGAGDTGRVNPAVPALRGGSTASAGSSVPSVITPGHDGRRSAGRTGPRIPFRLGRTKCIVKEKIRPKAGSITPPSGRPQPVRNIQSGPRKGRTALPEK
jgi:hypothetical protein